MDDGVTKPSKLDIFTRVGQVVLIPLALLIVGNFFSRSISENQLNAQYVETAIDILAEPKPETDDKVAKDADLALREWAVELLERSSPVPLSEDLATALRQGDVNLQTNAQTGDSFVGLATRPGSIPQFDFETGSLPEGCTVSVSGLTLTYGFVTETPVPVLEEPDPSAHVATTLEPGEYPATEFFKNPPVTILSTGGAFGYFKVAEGWVSTLDAKPSAACFP